jgi:Putative auto-transporter adhesin, head GIN domain
MAHASCIKNFLAMTYWLMASVMLVPVVSSAQMLSPYSATTVDFSGFIGNIRIEVGADKTINLHLKRGDVRLLKTTVHQGVLQIAYTPKIDTNDGLDNQGNITHIRSGVTVNQEIIIGNKKYGSGKAQDMAELIVRVPINVSLLAHDFVGDANIDAMSGPADLMVREGHINAKRLGPARLRVKGAGDIELGEATSEVRLGIDGAGDIHVKSGAVERVWADINGAGNIRYTGGRIQQAYVSARGAATITLDGVVKVSKGVVDGASEIDIRSGNSGQ